MEGMYQYNICANCKHWDKRYLLANRGLCVKGIEPGQLVEETNRTSAEDSCQDFTPSFDSLKNISRSKKLNLLGFEYEIEYVKEKISTPNTGCIDYKDQKIYIEEGWSEDNDKEIILHEIIHFINLKHSLGLDEGQVQTLSTCLHCIVKENKLFKEE